MEPRNSSNWFVRICEDFARGAKLLDEGTVSLARVLRRSVIGLAVFMLAGLFFGIPVKDVVGAKLKEYLPELYPSAKAEVHQPADSKSKKERTRQKQKLRERLDDQDQKKENSNGPNWSDGGKASEEVFLAESYCPNPPPPDTILVSIGNQEWFFYLEKECVGSVTYTAEFVSTSDAEDPSTPLAYNQPPPSIPKCCTGRVIRVTVQAVHYVQDGHILRVVAGMYNRVTVESLMKTNRRHTNNARRGEWLLVPLPGEQHLHWEYVEMI